MSLRDAEAAASRTIAKASALKGNGQSSSYFGFWSEGSAAGSSPANTPQAQSQEEDKTTKT